MKFEFRSWCKKTQGSGDGDRARDGDGHAQLQAARISAVRAYRTRGMWLPDHIPIPRWYFFFIDVIPLLLLRDRFRTMQSDCHIQIYPIKIKVTSFFSMTFSRQIDSGRRGEGDIFSLEKVRTNLVWSIHDIVHFLFHLEFLWIFKNSVSLRLGLNTAKNGLLQLICRFGKGSADWPPAPSALSAALLDA